MVWTRSKDVKHLEQLLAKIVFLGGVSVCMNTMHAQLILDEYAIKNGHLHEKGLQTNIFITALFIYKICDKNAMEFHGRHMPCSDNNNQLWFYLKSFAWFHWTNGTHVLCVAVIPFIRAICSSVIFRLEATLKNK